MKPLSLIFTVAAALITAAPLYAAPLDSLQRAYVNLRFGMFIHFGIETFNGGDYWNNNTPPAQSVWNLTAQGVYIFKTAEQTTSK
jgi:hypothetical protein